MDNCLVAGPDAEVQRAKTEMTEMFDCDDTGEMVEYVGCKVDYDRSRQEMRLTQPVMLQSFWDESGITTDGHNPTTPAIPGTILIKGKDHNKLSPTSQAHYRSRVGKLLHMMQWTCPNILNSVREAS